MSISVKDQFLKLKLKIGIQTKRQRLSQKHLKDSEVTVTQLQVRWTYFHVQSSPLCLDVNILLFSTQNFNATNFLPVIRTV